MWIKFRHRVIFKILHPIFVVYLVLKYGYRAHKYKLPAGPYLILYNHPTNLDPFMLALSFKGPIYFMANEDLFNRRFFSPILKYLVAPIRKSKSIRDIQAVKDTIRVIKEGGRVAIAPEGNRNYSGRLNYIDPSIVKLIRLLKVPVILYNIHGGFGVNPRFSIKLRKGQMFGQVKKVISVEEADNLDNDQLLQMIIENLDVDDVKLGYEYKGKALAENLESVFYICPKCKSMSSLYSNKHNFYCKNCGLKVEYTTQLLFKSEEKNFTFNTVNKYYVFQEKFIKEADIKTIKHLDSNITLLKVEKKRKRKLIYGQLITDNEKILIQDDYHEKEFFFEDIISISIVYHNTLIINLVDEQYFLVGDVDFNALKIMHLFYRVKNEKKGDNQRLLKKDTVFNAFVDNSILKTGT